MGVNWRLMAKIFFGWVITLVVVGFGSAALFCFGAFGPSIQQSDQINMWRDWAGGFTEGVRQALLHNQQLNVPVKTEGITLISDPSAFAFGEEDYQKDSFRDEENKPVWNTVLPHQIELLTNTKDGYQFSVFQDWSMGPATFEELQQKLNEDEASLGPLDKMVLLLNDALLAEEPWQVPFNVVTLDHSDGIDHVVVTDELYEVFEDEEADNVIWTDNLINATQGLLDEEDDGEKEYADLPDLLPKSFPLDQVTI